MTTTKKKEVAPECLLRTRPTFIQSLQSVGISKLSCTDLVFVDQGVKINDAYYRDVLLSKQLLPVMREISGEFFVSKQDNAPAHGHATLCDFSSNAGVHSNGTLASEQP